MIVSKENFKQDKKQPKGQPYLVIYYDKDLKCRQIIYPKTTGHKDEVFDGNWKALAHAISGGQLYKFEVR